MPGPYAHYYFGERVRETLPSWSRDIVDREPLAFYIGLQGPDFLFYGEVAVAFMKRFELYDQHKNMQVLPPTTQNSTTQNWSRSSADHFTSMDRKLSAALDHYKENPSQLRARLTGSGTRVPVLTSDLTKRRGATRSAKGNKYECEDDVVYE